jgi:hypothetical protein
MAHLGRNRAVRWFAPVALVGAVGLAACGEGSSDADVSARTAAPAGAVGSDVHLANQAAEIEARARVSSGSDVHLANQAAEIEARRTSGSDVHLANQAAENAEREAHLAGGAATAAQAALDSTSNDDFVPGTRRMPVR